tara:strand:+ start:12834 stop:14045 length:1212 start_codon:yes stop_codon:yes gene_type:complete
MAITKYPLRVDDIRRIRPSAKGSENIHFAIVPFSGLPQGIPDGPNVRSRDDLGYSNEFGGDLDLAKTSAKYKTLERTIQGVEGVPSKFHLKNGGIDLAVSSVVKVSDGLYHLYIDEITEGIINGGHTYELITRNVDAGTAANESVVVQIIEGMDQTTREEVAIAKNVQVNVDNTSIYNTKRVFDSMKDYFADLSLFPDFHPYADHIAYEMNSKALIPVGDVVSKLICLDVASYPLDMDKASKSKHPTQTYTGKTAALKRYADNLEHYEKMFPILSEILELSEIIQVSIPKLNAKTHKNGANSVGWVDTKKNVFFPILGQESKSNLVAGLVKPVLSGFRSLVDPNELKWDRSFTQVKKVLIKSLPDLLANLRDAGESFGNKPNTMAKDKRLWQECARIVNFNKQ